MTDRQKMILDVIMYKNYMNQINHKYDKHREIIEEIKVAERETDGFWKGIVSFIGLGSIIWGGFVTFYKFLMAQSPERVSELDIKVLNFLNPIEYLNIFLMVFGVLYLTIFLIRENKREKPYKQKLPELKKEKRELEKEMKEFYDKYENAPLDFQFSNPYVLDIIIDALESDEKITLKQVTENFLRKYGD